jgi:hypothetical protein
MLRAQCLALLMLPVVTVWGCGENDSTGNTPPPREPTISAISPITVAAGSSDLTLTITGANFTGLPHNRSQAAWLAGNQTTLLVTTFVSSTQLTAVLPESLLSSPITAQVFVLTGDPMGNVPLSKSNVVGFRVDGRQLRPLLSAISPTNAAAGSPDLTLALRGTNFTSGPDNPSQVIWVANGTNTLLATIFVSSTHLTAVIPASLLGSPVTAQVVVQSGDPTGGSLSKSNALEFRVQGEPPPRFGTIISAISPTSVVAGSPDRTLTITGVNFAGRAHFNSQAMWNANGQITALVTTFVSSTELTAVVPAALLSSPDTAQVFVRTGDPMSDGPLPRSNSLDFIVTPPITGGTGAIIVYGLPNPPRPIKGWREVSLDDGPFQLLIEGDSLIYSPVAAGDHKLALSNPCTSTHTPTVQTIHVLEGDTLTLKVVVPPDCE